MARAKRTHRAEARRRHRAATEADAGDVTEGSIEGESASSSSRGTSASRSSGATAPASTGRIGFAAAFRLSFRPMNVREDVAALPWIALHTKALWVPLAITIAATAYIIVTKGQDILSEFAFQYFIQTPAIAGVFLAGFLAPRASWLLGAIVGLFSAACYTLLIFAFASTINFARLSPEALPTEAQAREVAISAFMLSPVIGAFFAAGAAWYRRFLAYSSPNRSRQSQAQKPKAGDGRTRTSASQKAGLKR